MRILIDQKVNSDNTPGIYDEQGSNQLDPENLRRRYESCLQQQKSEKANWDMLATIFDTRMPLPPAGSLSFLKQPAASLNAKFHNAYPTSILEAASSAMVSFAAPLKEQGIQLVVEDSEMKKMADNKNVLDTLSKYTKVVSDVFNAPASAVHRNLLTTLFSNYAYGNCAVMSTFDQGQYHCVSLDFRQLVISVNEFTGEITHVFRERWLNQNSRYSRIGSINEKVYDLWMRKEGTVADNMSVLDANKRPYIFAILGQDFKVKNNKIVGLNYMPVHYGRLKTISGYAYGRGYGELLAKASQDLHQHSAEFGKTALFATNPCRIFNGLNSKKKAQVLEAIQTPGAVIALEEILPEIAPVTMVPTVNPSELQYFSSWWQELKDTINLGSFLRYYLLPENVNMTDTQVRQRVEEKVMMLSGIVTGIHNDLIEPSIRAILIKKIEDNSEPWVKSKLDTVESRIAIRNGFDKARDFVTAQTNVQAANVFIQLAAADPAVLDNMDFDMFSRDTAKMLGIDAKYLRSDTQVKNRREERKAQMQQMQQNQQQQAIGEVAMQDRGGG